MHDRLLLIIAVLVVLAVITLLYNRRKARYGLSAHFYALPKENTMSSVSPITSIPVGSSCVLAVVYTQNGNPFTNPTSGPAFTGLAVTSSDSDVTIAPATADATAGAVPLAQQFQISVASTDQAAAASFSITATAPDGSTVSGTASLGLTSAPPPPSFGLSAAFYPLPS